MLYRRTYLADNLTLPDSGTRTIDINVTDPITALWIKVQATNGGTSNRSNTIAECITAIEVIDGADVLYSMSGMQALALACAQLGGMPRQEVSEIAGDVWTFEFPIMFGRFMGDKPYAFDPSRFKNPQLRVSWNMATVTAVGATGFLTAVTQLSVVAHVMEGAPAPSRFLMSKNIYTWTGAAAGWEYIDLPTDYPWRGMLCRGFLAANPWHWCWDQTRLNCDGGKYIALNERGWDLVNQNTLLQPRLHYRHDFFAINNSNAVCILKEYETLVALPASSDDQVLAYTNAGAGQGTLRLYQAGGAEGTLTRVIAAVSGWLPYANLYMPFGIQSEPNDWFPATMFKGVKLEVRAGVASAMAVALTQDRAY